MSNSAYTDAVMLFGDSITESWAAGSLAHRMSEHYNRKLDVINRGFGGYTSEWAIPVFQQIFATKDKREQGCAQKVRLMTIWFGANDATEPGEPQHVPLDKYRANLAHLVKLVRSPSSPYFSPDTRIILINPGPIVLSDWNNMLAEEEEAAGRDRPPSKPQRDPKHVRLYAEACIEVAKEEDVPYVDFYSAIMQAAGSDTDEALRPFFSDGLHLTAKGYDVLFHNLVKVISASYPELDPEALERSLPSLNLANANFEDEIRAKAVAEKGKAYKWTWSW